MRKGWDGDPSLKGMFKGVGRRAASAGRATARDIDKGQRERAKRRAAEAKAAEIARAEALEVAKIKMMCVEMLQEAQKTGEAEFTLSSGEVGKRYFGRKPVAESRREKLVNAALDELEQELAHMMVQ